MEDVLTAHEPSRWRSFTNDNEILRCCGTDYGNATRKASRGDSDKAWAAWTAHVAQALAEAGYGSQHDAWDEGITRGREVAAWAIGRRPKSERPDMINPYRKASE